MLLQLLLELFHLLFQFLAFLALLGQELVARSLQILSDFGAGFFAGLGKTSPNFQLLFEEVRTCLLSLFTSFPDLLRDLRANWRRLGKQQIVYSWIWFIW